MGSTHKGRRNSEHTPTAKHTDQMGKPPSKGGGRGPVHNKGVHKGDADGNEGLVGSSEVHTKAAGNSFGL